MRPFRNLFVFPLIKVLLDLSKEAVLFHNFFFKAIDVRIRADDDQDITFMN